MLMSFRLTIRNVNGNDLKETLKKMSSFRLTIRNVNSIILTFLVTATWVLD